MGWGNGVLLSLWLSDVDGTDSGDGADCALICNNNKTININEIINYYMYIEMH